MKKFNNGDIVYWCDRTGYEFSVKWGRVDEQFSRSLVYVDYLVGKETRLVNGVPIDEFVSEDKYRKLPKGWSYDTKLYELTYQSLVDSEEYKDSMGFDVKSPESIKDLYDRGLLVKKSSIFRGYIDAEVTNKGYRIVKKVGQYNNDLVSTSIRSDMLYRSYDEAKKIVDSNVAELERQSNLSYYDWSIEQIDNTLNKLQRIINISDDIKLKYREWLLDLDNIEEVDTRVFNRSLQWKYTNNKLWRNIELG